MKNENISVEVKATSIFLRNSMLPVDLDDLENLVNSRTWESANAEQKRKFIGAVVTFTTILERFVKKYRAKKTLKGEFIACVLSDWWYDLVSKALMSLDYELYSCYSSSTDKELIDVYSDELLDRCENTKRWIKILKKAYKKNKKEIKKYTYNEETKSTDLELVNDISVEYRDYLYQ